MQRVTLENEFIPAWAIREASESASFDPNRVVPGIETLATIQDKLLQRDALALAGVPAPKAKAIVDGLPSEFTFPVVLKARFGGYDGKGTRYARTIEEFEAYRPLWETGEWLAEEFVPFLRELAVMVVSTENETLAYPTYETIQTNHVCDLVFPCTTDASEIAKAAVEAVKGRGLFGVELFELESGEVLVNELAPRPHNSGHYTLDWGSTSQFEQHVRVATGLPLGSLSGGHPVCMANLLGQETAGDPRVGLARALAYPGIHVHWYGKTQSRPGRKMGHLNAVGANCVERAVEARAAFYLGMEGSAGVQEPTEVQSF